MKIIRFIILLTFIITTDSFNQTKLTIDEAIKIALQRNTSLIKEKNNILTNESDVKSAYGNFLPSLSTGAGFTWQRVSSDGLLQKDFLGNITEVPPSETETRSYSVNANSNWVLFDGLSNFANLSRSQNSLEAAKNNFKRLKENIVYQTLSYYYQVLSAEELLKARQDNLTYNQKFLESINEKNRLGSVSLADVYAQQVQAGNAELLLIQAQNAFENAKSNLLNYLALDIFEDYTFEMPAKMSQLDYPHPSEEFKSISEMVSIALEKRADYISAKFSLESAFNGVTIARSGLFPSLSANGGFSTSALNMGDLFNRRVYQAGLSLNIPIFSNWNTENQIQSNLVRAKNAEEDLTALERQIKIEIKQGFLDLEAAKKSLDVSTKNVISATENRKVANERYNLGSQTILNVLQADRDYAQALKDKIDVQFEYYRLRDRLINYLGELEISKYE